MKGAIFHQSPPKLSRARGLLVGAAAGQTGFQGSLFFSHFRRQQNQKLQNYHVLELRKVTGTYLLGKKCFNMREKFSNSLTSLLLAIDDRDVNKYR